MNDTDKLRDMKESIAKAIQRSKQNIEDIQDLEKVLRKNLEELKELRKSKTASKLTP